MMTVKKIFAYSILALFTVILMVPAASSAGETRIISHDGIDGWKCETKSAVGCNGINKFPITVVKSNDDGQPAPSLYISGDPGRSTPACAAKTITSDWYIEKVELSFDIKSTKTSYVNPLTIIDGKSKPVDVENWTWSSGSHTKSITYPDNDVIVQLCHKDTSSTTNNIQAYYDNIKITTTEVDPAYVVAQEEAERQAEQETADAEKAADAAEAAQKAAEEKAKEDERKAEADEARADAADRSALAIERSTIAAERAMLAAERAMIDAEKALEYANREASFLTEAADAKELALKAMKKADESRERLDEAERALELYQQEKAQEKAQDARDAADAAIGYADQVHTIALSIPSSFAQSESGGGVVSTPDGGCLIATAAFGSEMAPQVQFLRELRDNTVLQTESGTSFMTGFNQFYYSFSPAVADYERENPAFKEAVKITLTPLLASLTLLQYADIDSESEMVGYGIGVILLNIGMYFVAPAVLIMAVRKRI